MAKRSFAHFVEQELGKFPHFVIFAVLELVLIILLFIDGFLSFLANEFSKFFELQTPCLLCTRIDHALVHCSSNFYYNNSLCESHKRNVSSLAYCHNHQKLSDIRKICEACLLSFAMEKESNCSTYKSLVGILHKDLECFVEDDHQILSLPSGKNNEFIQIEESGNHLCSCCGKPLKVKSSRLKEKVPFSQAPAPSPRAPFLTSKNEENRGLDLPHIRYSKLKFIAGNESDLPEDEDASNRKNFKEDVEEAATEPLLTEAEELNEDMNKTPSSVKGNKFFGIPLTDSANNSPRWGIKLPKKSSIGKPEFPSESGDDDSILHSLKRQVRLDRKSLMALYMELDEERSASAVAANNAMAMITRLQAEKAAMQMEALQYQRMMEEQAEYDQEALQAANDLILKRDEELKNLEAELEGFKKSEKKNDFSPDDDVHSFRSNSDSVIHEEEGMVSLSNMTGNSEKISLTMELSRLCKRVRALEEDSGLLTETTQTDGEGRKFLTEISRNLQKLQNLIAVSFEDDDA